MSYHEPSGKDLKHFYGFFTGFCRDCGKSQKLSPAEMTLTRHLRCTACGGVLDPSKEHVRQVSKARDYMHRQINRSISNCIYNMEKQ